MTSSCTKFLALFVVVLLTIQLSSCQEDQDKRFGLGGLLGGRPNNGGGIGNIFGGRNEGGRNFGREGDRGFGREGDRGFGREGDRGFGREGDRGFGREGGRGRGFRS